MELKEGIKTATQKKRNFYKKEKTKKESGGIKNVEKRKKNLRDFSE